MGGLFRLQGANMDDNNDLIDKFESGDSAESESFLDRLKGKIGMGDDDTPQSADTGEAADIFQDVPESGESTLYDKIESESTTLGRLMGKIPGIGGYMEKSRRREADQLLRKTVVAQLEQARLQLGNVQQAMSRDIILAMDYAEPLGRVDTRLMGLIGKIGDAPTGYAGFFSAVKIKEEELARIYDFDEKMFDHADLIVAHVAALQKAVRDSGDIDSAISDLDNATQNAQMAFNERQQLLSGFA
jgi:hypothetical protein